MNLDNNSNMSLEHEETRYSTITKGQVEEFVPTNNNDPILVQLRRLFVSSFSEYYNIIESQLNLPKGITLQHWLENAFDEEANELLSHKCRCFLISTPPPSSVIIGFLTIVDTGNNPNGIYISQCAIDPIFKRKGYGLLLLKYLTSLFPATTLYTCLCRRVNKPALQFYQKCGATLIDDGQIATHYGYNPLDYLGFQFTSHQLQS